MSDTRHNQSIRNLSLISPVSNGNGTDITDVIAVTNNHLITEFPQISKCAIGMNCLDPVTGEYGP